jgi:hypothetical protein
MFADTHWFFTHVGNAVVHRDQPNPRFTSNGPEDVVRAYPSLDVVW